MTKCFFGFHQWEFFSASKKIDAVVGQILREHSYYESDTNYDYIKQKNGYQVVIPDFNISDPDLESISHEKYIQICSACGKVKQNFTNTSIVNKTYDLINHYESACYRRHQAKQVFDDLTCEV